MIWLNLEGSCAWVKLSKLRNPLVKLWTVNKMNSLRIPWLFNERTALGEDFESKIQKNCGIPFVKLWNRWSKNEFTRDHKTIFKIATLGEDFEGPNLPLYSQEVKREPQNLTECGYLKNKSLVIPHEFIFWPHIHNFCLVCSNFLNWLIDLSYIF